MLFMSLRSVIYLSLQLVESLTGGGVLQHWLLEHPGWLWRPSPSVPRRLPFRVFTKMLSLRHLMVVK